MALVLCDTKYIHRPSGQSSISSFDFDQNTSKDRSNVEYTGVGQQFQSDNGHTDLEGVVLTVRIPLTADNLTSAETVRQFPPIYIGA